LALFWVWGATMVLCTTSAAAQTTTSTSATDTEAHALFEAGRTAYNDARYEDALQHYRQSYELSHRPELLYNIGQCEDRLRHDAEAIEAFDAFLVALPDAPQRTEVTARLEILRRSGHAAEATTDSADTSEADTTTTDTTIAPEPVAPVAPAGSDPAPWIVLGVGAGVAIVGAILLGVGYGDIATVDGATGVRFATVSGAYNDAPVLTGAGWGVLGLGVALAGVGLVWGLTSGGGSSEHAQLRLGPTGITVSGSF
jgi:hypothetical protein